MSKSAVFPGFHALSEPVRIQIIELLQDSQELCVNEIAGQLGINQSRLSFHLKILNQSGLAITRRQGRYVYYSLNVEQFSMLEEYLSQMKQFEGH
ncbi:helix-turn-helix transcriptional regulator [cf. Phormidesmis sp. LEGE 11477]|uniref:ArsR/SmtB family transcription factor n=1 Tax=cf. Phormidesmis sp. LEGE 11477 TaxID=1828680 RepID=UPI00187FEE23|nr:metalloregulator ArsR/SmtB family transcription factor [cf. Phormidesmis sp. LEGE 11477]MBE9064488.1 winged helix-turn-helix transcriptional regulator [cf. Phormidesmis sp. LEGE 11477]